MSDEGVSIGEVGRAVAEVKGIVLTLVSLREYMAFQEHVRHRFEQLEEESKAARSAARNAMWGAIGSLVGAVILAAWVKSGGH